MNISGIQPSNFYAAIKSKNGPSVAGLNASYLTSQSTDKVSISDAAKQLASRAEIEAKGQSGMTAEDVDYLQKSSGLVNTMAHLSPKEKALYNELVASGNSEAVEAMNMIALARDGSKNNEATLSDGQSFNPSNTEITADNIRNLFKHIFADSNGSTSRKFDALASYLDQREVRKA